MKNKVAEMFGLMIHNKKASDFFQEGWLCLYNDLLANPIKAMKEGEIEGALNTICGMALLDWYESQDPFKDVV